MIVARFLDVLKVIVDGVVRLLLGLLFCLINLRVEIVGTGGVSEILCDRGYPVARPVRPGCCRAFPAVWICFKTAGAESFKVCNCPRRNPGI